MKTLRLAMLLAALALPDGSAAQYSFDPYQPQFYDEYSLDWTFSIDSVGRDWRTTFPTASDRRDFPRLRAYRREKELLLAYMMPQEEALRYARDQARRMIQQAQVTHGAVSTYRDADAVMRYDQDFNMQYHVSVALGSVPAELDSDMVARTIKHYEDELTRWKDREKDLERASFRLAATLSNLKADIRDSESAIEIALAPEYREMNFRMWVSIFFSALVAVMIISFFVVVYKSSGRETGGMLLGHHGLQFVTIFVLISAIILFGILNVLEGRELAAILAGIAGYILGRTANELENPGHEDKSKTAEN